MKRRQFLKAVFGGAVAAVVPLPAPPTPTKLGTFYSTEAYGHCIGVSEGMVKKIWLNEKLIWSKDQQPE